MAALVHATNPDARFLMVGGGPADVARYRDLAETLGVGDAIRFAGLVPGREVQDHLAAMDLFVLPSLVESGPYTILEAMAAGLPIVATEVGFVPQVVENGVTGYVVPIGDPDALASAVRRVIDGGDGERLGANGRNAVLEHHSVSSMVDQIVAVYRSVGVRVPDAVPAG
jgi:glycosyltransferase involved in cell wall biosynthesis